MKTLKQLFKEEYGNDINVEPMLENVRIWLEQRRLPYHSSWNAWLDQLLREIQNE
jgi:hypothetical protein